MYYSMALHILPIVCSLFSSLPPSWTITVHLRNPARSAVQWCPIANRFRTTPTTTIPLYPSCLLSNLAPPSPPSGSSTPLPSLLCSAHTFPVLSSSARWPACAQKGDFPNLVMRGKGEQHLLGPWLFRHPAPPPLEDPNIHLLRPGIRLFIRAVKV